MKVFRLEEMVDVDGEGGSGHQRHCDLNKEIDFRLGFFREITFTQSLLGESNILVAISSTYLITK